MNGNGVVRRVLRAGDIVDMVAGPKDSDVLGNIRAHLQDGGSLDEGAKAQLKVHFDAKELVEFGVR